MNLCLYGKMSLDNFSLMLMCIYSEWTKCCMTRLMSMFKVITENVAYLCIYSKLVWCASKCCGEFDDMWTRKFLLCQMRIVELLHDKL